MLSPSSHRRARPPAPRTPRAEAASPVGVAWGARSAWHAAHGTRVHALRRAPPAGAPPCRRALPGGHRGGVPARRRRRASRPQGARPPPHPLRLRLRLRLRLTPHPPARPHAPPPLQAENIVFAAKGSPVIKFIDFGGACTWTAEEGLTGLVGTPQYVAPEVVTGYGEDKPTDAPYGKGCVAPEHGLGRAGVGASRG